MEDQMKYKKLVIETNGTTAGTKITIDDQQIGQVQRIEFSADLNEVFPVISVQVPRKVNGIFKTKKVQVRDTSTQKFVMKDKVETESLVLERTI